MTRLPPGLSTPRLKGGSSARSAGATGSPPSPPVAISQAVRASSSDLKASMLFPSVKWHLRVGGDKVR